MAKRKRLTPTAMPRDRGGEAGAVSARPSLSAEIAAPAGPAPIAGVSGAQAMQAALDELSGELSRARAEGRMILPVPLDRIETDYLVRDRVALDDDEMRALITSLRTRGQQTPIELAELGGGRFGLISGWRRCQALARLAAETGESRYATVLALVRRPAESAEAYLAMVEENEIRVGLSYFERARIVAKSVDQGVFETKSDALRGLFGSASRAKRSKIGSFLPVVAALDGMLRFPEAVGERLGLSLSKALEEPGFAQGLRKTLAAHAPDSPEAEQTLLAEALAATRAAAPAPRPREAGAAAGTADLSADLPDGLRAERRGDGALILSGPALTDSLRARLLDWLAKQR
jgi:hypothetical protein